MSRSKLEKSSKEYFLEVVETVKGGDIKTTKFNHLVEHEDFDPKEVSLVWGVYDVKDSYKDGGVSLDMKEEPDLEKVELKQGLYVTGHDGVLDAAMKLHYIINVTEDLESVANLQIGIKAYAEDVEDDLDLIALAISQKMKRGWSVTVHCALGMERSCLAVAWYMSKYCKMTLDDAYDLIAERRPIAVDRREYLVRS